MDLIAAAGDIAKTRSDTLVLGTHDISRRGIAHSVARQGLWAWKTVAVLVLEAQI